MDTRIKFLEVRQFIKSLREDYKSSNKEVKINKKKAILKTIRLTVDQIWSGLTAPIIYPIWYIFRVYITKRMYQNTSWEHVQNLVRENKIGKVKELLKPRGRLLYWLWTYGDLKDPLGRGELPDSKINKFSTRYYENAIRNPRFTINYMEYRSGAITQSQTLIDTRNYEITHFSEGIGSAPSGILFKWMIDESNEWYFIYDDNNKNNLFYFGYSGLNKHDIGHNGRFEIGYRKN